MTQHAIKTPVMATITSGKGGVGKTFVTVNLAASLAARGQKVLVVDCDLGLANADIMLGLHPRLTLKDVLFGTALPEEVIIPTKGGFDLLPSCSGVREMAQLLFEKIQIVKSVLSTLEGYDVMLLDTGAGIAETVLQFNLLAPRNIVVLNRELTSITDAYALMKVMHQIFGRDTFSLVVNAVADEREGERIFHHVDGICRRFLGFGTDYLGLIFRDEAVPKSILRQEPLVLAGPGSKTAACFDRIADAVCRWGKPLPRVQSPPGPERGARGILH
ncbi:MAG TPA: MinD/ParA family protein [Deltaproteobacteria bacterium]|nr:MinD/ParA family protein [Deltaproteobacteria bacterium]